MRVENGAALALERARRGLRQLAGLAASPVLDARLQRAAHLLPDLPPEPRLEEGHWAALLDAATVQETRLFRAPAQLAMLEAELAAQARLARAAGQPLRLLSAGCATGEESYTLAAIALHVAGAEAPGLAVEVLGIDVCRPALQAAEAGVINPRMGAPLANVPAHHLPWFEGPGGESRLHPALRATLAFRRANLLDLPDDLGVCNVILCRNVLIYMEPAARMAVLAALAARLAPGGLLGLGATDTGPQQRFRRLGQALYRHD